MGTLAIFEEFLSECKKQFEDDEAFEPGTAPLLQFSTDRGNYHVAEFKIPHIEINFDILMSQLDPKDVIVEIVLEQDKARCKFVFPEDIEKEYNLYYFIESLMHALVCAYLDVFDGKLGDGDSLKTFIRGKDKEPVIREDYDIFHYLKENFSK